MATTRLIDERFVLSRPFPVEWAGFRSDTYTLQRAGWRLAVDRELSDYGRNERLQLLGEHRTCRLRFRAVAPLSRYCTDFLRPEFPTASLPTFLVQVVAPDFEMHREHANEMPVVDYWTKNFEAIDARPMYVTVDRLSMAQLFAPANTGAEEIFVKQADLTVLEHLEAIKKLQAPIQTEIRENQRRQEWREGQSYDAAPESKVLANVIQLVA